MHNENSYQQEWPLRLAFCCLVPATTEGETPLADMNSVTAALDSELFSKFEQRGVRYVRHYHPYIDVPWQQVFQTEDRSVVAKICAQRQIQHEWLDDDVLRTVQTCQGTATHPVTGVKTIFNQAHLFHVTSNGTENAEQLIDTFGADRLPRQSSFGDGEEIPLADLQSLRMAFESQKIMFSWQKDDVVLIDNMQVAHGRQPFTGPRKLLAALLDSNRAL
jgi:alpha-ketoglutarate-dependent taurine dioxygenase